MKFSALSLFFALVTPALATSNNNVQGTDWTDLHSDVRVVVKGTHGQIGLEEIAFINQSVIKAYNVVHKDMGDGYVAMYSEPESVSVKKEEPAMLSSTSAFRQHMNALLSLWQTEDKDEQASLDFGKKKKRKLQGDNTIVIVHAHVDIACNLCGPADDDAYLAAFESAAKPLREEFPLDNIEAVSKKLCEIIKAEGSKDNFDRVESCSITSVHPLASVAYDSEKDNQAQTTRQADTLAVTLSGLDCHDAVECQDESLRQSFSDALTIAYNQVNFVDDMYIHDFAVQSLDLFQAKGFVPKASGADVPLRGITAKDDFENDLQVGEWKGTVDVHCRVCASTKNVVSPFVPDADPMMERFYALGEVESIFCDLVHDMAPFFPALANVGECSLAMVQTDLEGEMTVEEVEPETASLK